MNTIKRTDGIVFTPSKVIGIGLNYSEHIAEMQSKRTNDPVIFVKPNSAVVSIYDPIKIPTIYGAVHHEIELAVLIDKTGFNIPQEKAMDYVGGFGLALDLTLRDLQKKAKERGHPWAIAKGFNGACPVSEFVPANQISNPQNLKLQLTVNGSERQNGNTNQMLFKIPELIAYVSKFFPFEPGDVILTGTPSGVGPLMPGDRLKAVIESVATVQTTCVGW